MLWAAYVAQPVVVPVVLAWTIATIVLPARALDAGPRPPRALAVVIVALALIALIVTLLAVLSTPVTYWLGRASRVRRADAAEAADDDPAAGHAGRGSQGAERHHASSGEGGIKVETQSGTLVTTIVGVLTPAVSQFILFIGALIFYLVYQKRIRTTAVFFVRDREARLTTLRTLERHRHQHDRLFRHVHRG